MACSASPINAKLRSNNRQFFLSQRQPRLLYRFGAAQRSSGAFCYFLLHELRRPQSGEENPEKADERPRQHEIHHDGDEVVELDLETFE